MFVKQLRKMAQSESWKLRLEIAQPPKPGWQQRAACHGQLNLMYPVDLAGLDIAVDICRSCPVRLSCLGDARATEEGLDAVYGVRAGLAAEQRLAVYRRIPHLKPCGTNAAYVRHLRHDEPADPACLAAHRLDVMLNDQRAGRTNHHKVSA